MTATRATTTSAGQLECKTCHRSPFRRQFGRPTGLLGALVGRLMARKNAAMNHIAIELLDVQPADRVLEIGFGPGVGIQDLSERATDGLVAGIDPSEVMVRQATRRNRRAIAAGLVVLKHGSAAGLPFEDDAFDKVLAVNTFHHWGSAETGLLEVKRVIRPGGLLLLGLRMALDQPRRLSAPGLTGEQVEAARAQLVMAGFQGVHTVERSAGRRMTCMFGSK
jgi:SAM-dependent methyltransferase